MTTPPKIAQDVLGASRPAPAPLTPRRGSAKGQGGDFTKSPNPKNADPFTAIQGRNLESRFGCAGKQRYPDKRAAISQINLFKRHSRGRHGRPDNLRAYPCPHCRGWHLTKTKAKP